VSQSLPWLRFLSPLIKPDVPISGIRLSDWLHRRVHDIRPSMQMLRDNIQVVTVFALRYSSLQCRLISMVLIGIRQSPILGFFESTPEVRVLCSTGITRHQHSYDPVRLPPGPPSENDVEAATLIPNGSPPITCITFPTCCAHYPGGSNGCTCRRLPHSRGLPQMTGWSASALSLSRPAQASHALPPVELLSRPRRPLSRGFSPAGYPTKPRP
jgi:hypothetical protein